MEKEDLKKWFWNKFNSCYLLEDEQNNGNYFMCYDENFLRQKKFSRILNEEIIIQQQKSADKKVFYQDWKNGYLNCDYDNIWSFFEENYIDNYNEIRDLITWILESNDKTRTLTPIMLV